MFFIKKPVAEYTAQIYDRYPWIIEGIDSSFDDVLCHLNPDRSFIYGGAVRDILAGMPLIGDLDIIIETDIFKQAVDIFRFSSRWVLKDITDGSKYDRPIVITPDKLTQSSGNITKIATFVDKYSNELQLISPIKYNSELVDTIPCSRTAWDIVRYVDIRCSGVLVTLFGDLYEAVPGAVDDCRNRVLSTNQFVNKDTIGVNRLHKRVDKLSKRGWINKINMNDYPIIPIDIKSTNDDVKTFNIF